MVMKIFGVLVVAVVIVGGAAVLYWRSSDTTGDAQVSGQVLLGPLCPNADGDGCVTPPDPELSYKAREVVVYDSARSFEVARVGLDSSGRYELTLPPGEYVLDHGRIGIDRSDDVPESFSVKGGEELDISFRIDTGNR